MTTTVAAGVPARPIADELFFVVFDEYGRGRLQTRVAGLALAGGLLAELAWAGRLSVSHDRVVLPAGATPEDALAHLVLEVMQAQSKYTDVRTWLSFWGRRAIGDVGERLERAGLVVPRRLRRGGSAWVPTDRTKAAWPLVRLQVFLRDVTPLDWRDAVLLALCRAAGLWADVLRDSGAEGRDYAEYLLKQVERDLPAVAGVIAHVEAAIGDAVLHHRT
jgi:hypothetical protein